MGQWTLEQCLKCGLAKSIQTYRATLGCWLYPCCRFEPTCSAFSLDALNRYPLTKALWFIAKRLLSCHPLGNSGYDPVP